MVLSRIGNELMRKAIHLSALMIPIIYSIRGKQDALLLTTAGLFFALLVEMLRKIWPGFSLCFQRHLGRLLRERERQGITGATCLLLSAFICIVFFEQWIALVCLYFLLIGDALGALIGKLYGRHFIFHHRSWEGCLVFLAACLAVVLLVPDVPLRIALPGVGVAFLIDVYVQGIDDNLTIPLGSGLFMQILYFFLMN